MSKSVRKIPILRYGLIVLLVSILFSGAFYLYLHYNSARKLQGSIGKLISARENSELIDSCLLNLYGADNSSRLYAVTGNKIYIKQFYTQINNLNGLLDKIKANNSNINTLSPDKLKQLINQKATKTNSYIQLRILTDSLIKATFKIDTDLAYNKVKIAVPVVQTTKTTVHIDTLKIKAVSPEESKRKKFFGRLIASIAGKNNQQKAADAAPVLVKRDTLTKTIVQAGTVYASIPKKASNYYRKIYKANTTMRHNEHDILLINNNLIIDIISKLKQYKTLELAYTRESKAELAGKVTDVFKGYNSLAKLTLVAIILLLVVVLYNIWKIFINANHLVSDSEKARSYADNKSKFMANMSHEIRTPLNSVIGFSEQLSMSKLSPDQTEQINAIRNSSHMLLKVVNEVLDFSKYETGKMNFEQQPFMLHHAISDVLNSVSIQAAKKGLALKRSFLFDEDVCFSGDVLRLKQVIMNLLVNAIKFTPTGEILLHVMLLPKKNQNHAILKVRIKDTGIGIKKQDLPLIFNEFAQVGDAQKVTHHKGTGLGLAICKKIIELQGGRIKVISEPGKGSVFSFEIPFDIDKKENCIIEQPVSEEVIAQKVSGAHLLLAEDNPLNVLLAKTILKKWNISCDIATNGQEAIELFEENSYDLVLTDIQMPILGGLELLSLIRANPNSLRSEIPVIALTANVLKEDRDIYMEAGMNDIVLKPFVECNLVEKISACLKTKYTSTAPRLFRYG
jgi:signal transduction histidine kinase/FixJ family two-component response regulator/CHASE3 domain sensor protein